MKKLFIALTAIILGMSTQAQVLDIYKDGVKVATYKTTEMDKAQFRPQVNISSITLNKTTLELPATMSEVLTATAAPTTADDQTYTWSSADETIATVSTTGKVTGVAEGTTTITCKANDAGAASATCTVTITAAPTDTHEYVDLGLPSGTLWAKCNIGAENIYDYGDYFAWGETEGYNSGKTDFSWDTYKYYKSGTKKDTEGFDVTTSGVTKYATSSSTGYDGFYDDKTTLDAEDDAATANWGSNWKMPSQTQFNELQDNCTWTWCALNSVYGYKVVSTNGNYIFLPAAGYRRDSCLVDAGSRGYYWSSELYSDGSYGAWILYFSSSDVGTNGFIYRYYGHSVRPVRTAAN